MSTDRGDRTEQEFEEFALARTPQLYRSAWLLCGDRHQAEDLVQETLAKVYVRWRRPLSSRIDNPAAYAQTTLTRTFLSAKRRRSSTELPYADLPDSPVADQTELSDVRFALRDALAGLAPADRVVLVLRYLDDLSVEEVARPDGDLARCRAQPIAARAGADPRSRRPVSRPQEGSTMNPTDHQLETLFRDSSSDLSPDVADLVAGGIARGRARRRRQGVGAALATVAVVGVIGVAASVAPGLVDDRDSRAGIRQPLPDPVKPHEKPDVTQPRSGHRRGAGGRRHGHPGGDRLDRSPETCPGAGEAGPDPAGRHVPVGGHRSREDRALPLGGHADHVHHRAGVRPGHRARSSLPKGDGACEVVDGLETLTWGPTTRRPGHRARGAGVAARLRRERALLQRPGRQGRRRRSWMLRRSASSS